MVAMRGEIPEGVNVHAADLGLTIDEHCRAWKSEGLDIMHRLVDLYNNGQISFERYQDALRAMSQMARSRREFEKAVFGEELK